MTYQSKQLSSSDAAVLKELLRVFGEAFGEPDTYQGKIPDDAYLASLLGEKHFIALVALDSGKVVGGLAAYVLDKFEQERREIFIYDLAVAKEYRRRGIATGLIQQLRRIARDLGAYVIFVQADMGDTAAIRLYESLGKGEDVIIFDIKVESQGENQLITKKFR